MNNPIPSKPGIIYNNMNLAVSSKFRRPLDQVLDVCIVKDIPDNSECLATVLRDGFGGGGCFACIIFSFPPLHIYPKYKNKIKKGDKTNPHQYPQ